MAIYRGSGSASSTSDQATIDEVTQQATNAASSATSAASSASSAASSASSASTSASTATTKASAASTSATSAASSASSASTSASSASTSASSASSSATAAAASETAAETAKTGAVAAQTAAESAETNAATSETNAATSETNAATSAANASTSATSAASSASSAASAQTAAESARDSTLASFDSFDDRYLGAKSADPTLDNDGDALVGGALYFNTVDEAMKVYTGSAWVAAYADVSGALLAVNNLSDLGNAASARTNLGLGTAATTASTDYATAAQGTLAASATQPGDNISTLTNDSGYSTTTGTVTSVAATVPTGLTVTGSPITSTGTLAVAYDTGYAIPTTAKQTQWDTAYGWGDHSTQNYATTTGDTMTGALNFGDNVKAQFGASNDLQIYHDSSHSYITDAGTGSLRINGNNLELSNASYTANYLVANNGSNVQLYYNGSPKITTASGGVTVTGTVTADGVSLGDNEKAQFGASNDLQIYHDGSHSYVLDNGEGELRLRGSSFVKLQDTSGNNMFLGETGSASRIYHNNSEKFATTANGVSVTGTAVGTLTTDNDLSFDMNASNQFKCTPTGNGTLTFTNITSGQSGNVWLDNSGGHTISAAATTYIASADLTTISTAGVYFLSYYSDGTNVMVSATPAVTSTGA
jgi:hypothetical protein